MTTHTTPMEALRRLLEVSKQIDFADCKDERVWQALGVGQAVAEGVLRDYVEPVPVGNVNRYMNGTASVHGTAILALPNGTSLYAAPAAQPAAVAASVPEGWKLVPKAPTEDMIIAFAEQWYSKRQAIDDPDMNDAYAAMLAAAPAIAAPTEVERDAARYRWLRACDWFSSEFCVLRNPKKALTFGAGLGADCPSLTRLDDFIDAAIATGEKHE